MSRYNRHIILSEIGPEGQDKLSKAKVLVIGAGGLGCPILQYLTAAGVGTIGIIDFDKVELSNLQRQVLFGTSSLGENKAIAAKNRLEDLNSDIEIEAYPEALTYQNALELFNQYDIIVDGSDNFETRYLVNDACIITKKPLVFGAIYKFEGQVSVFNYNNGPSYRCLFPKPPKKDAVPNCSEIGVLGVLPGIIGSMQANEIIKLILGIGDVLSGKFLCYNALLNQTSTLKINRNDAVISEVLNRQSTFGKRTLKINCETNDIVSIQDIINNENIQFIDIRETHEAPKVDELSVKNIPLSSIQNHLEQLNNDKAKYFFCQSGTRSKRAVVYLKEQGIINCYSIEEGALEIKNYLKEQFKEKTNVR
ncbi:HesA/MoeB/ThiF family protein [Seonamhaeicola aphaedonensis]|uniref:Molybdopterin-synthase adenylyltransferase n=1 Tax=Seonamhaeicola aphaedonensis TaxID=1461338 RepID=A0A3D9H5Y2_9FLAO|nr:HesA/MoeB/ThiF family protein [Seonamhaeicola aphaedonensis]RED44910.1 adenylyltransferase/sulfurtransferase [Seonamhaeicola aphaedonensis]